MTDQTLREQRAQHLAADHIAALRIGPDALVHRYVWTNSVLRAVWASRRKLQDRIAEISTERGNRRVVTTVAELDALPIGSVILLEYGVVAQAVGGEEDITATGWMGIGHGLQWTSAQVVEHAGEGASFTVLYVPKSWSMTWCMCGHHERWHADGPCTFHSDTEECRCPSMEPHPENGDTQ